jgi:hypothetical protein
MTIKANYLRAIKKLSSLAANRSAIDSILMFL